MLSLSSQPLCLLFMLLPLLEMLFLSQQLARTLSPVGPIDCNLSGSSVHGIFQARILECGAISYSRGIFTTQGSNLSLLNLLLWQRILYSSATWEAPTNAWLVPTHLSGLQ